MRVRAHIIIDVSFVQYVPEYFASKYLKSNVAVKLQSCNGEEWEVN